MEDHIPDDIKSAVNAVVEDIVAFEKSDSVQKVKAAQRAFRAALQDLYEARLAASFHVHGFVDRVERCIDAEHQLIRRLPHDPVNEARHDASTRTFGYLIGAKMRLELCATALRIKDFDLDEDIEKDTLCDMDEAREELAELIGKGGEPKEPIL